MLDVKPRLPIPPSDDEENPDELEAMMMLEDVSRNLLGSHRFPCESAS